MAIEEVPEPGAAQDLKPEEPKQELAQEAADFITSQVLDKDATFFGG